MKKRYTFILPLLLVLTLSADSSTTNNNSKKLIVLEQSTLQAIEKHYLLNLFSNPRVNINNQTIYIELDIDREILNFEPIDQFKNFKMFTRNIRFILKNHYNQFGDSLSRKNIIIRGQSDENIFVYDSKLPNKNIIYLYESNLSLNQNIVFSSSEFKRLTYQFTSNSYIERVNGYNDLDIHRYARRLFNVMTKNGKYYNPHKDDKLLLKAICDKFNISPEEFTIIDNKYFLFPELPY